ncbi:PP2C family protein-serine/threonine phosphatase [Streptomyces tritici]|uniref:PP2C family protein-serine/threonine phosphatase n=1 Tax=Streptomyces tritici TaxID=2054410 RepID=UPI003AEF71B8
MSASEGPQETSAREHAAVRDRLRALEEAAERLGTTLDTEAVCRELVHLLHDRLRLCDAAAVDLLPEPAEAKDAPTEDFPAAAPSRPGQRASGHRVARSGPAELLEAADPADLVTVPLAAQGLLHGTLLVTRAAAAFTGHERATLRTTARLAALHLGHARRLAAIEDTALHLQRALVAEPGRPHPNLEVAGRYLPAGRRTLVGGDWFETVRLHFGRTLLVVGDVMGHGLDAAVDMNAYRTALREVASTDLPPHRVLRQLDAAVAEDGARRPATCLLVQVDPARGAAGFASAGHLPPVVFTADGSAEIVDVPVGPPLGTGVGGYELGTRELSAHETLLLFTDGLVERRGEDIDHSLDRLAGVRMPPGSGLEAVVEEVLVRLDARNAEDDVAVLAARIRDRTPVSVV